MEVILEFITPLNLIVKAIRKCWASEGASDSIVLQGNYVLGARDKALIQRIISYGHTSTLEHSLATFDISGISRACLQELSRHRIGVSPSVESTRYTMSKILKVTELVDSCIVSSGDIDIDVLNKRHMEELKIIVNSKGLSNDIAKYGLVEAYKVNELISFNIRSLRHFLSLRTSRRALKEIRELAQFMYDILPEDYKFLFVDCICED